MNRRTALKLLAVAPLAVPAIAAIPAAAAEPVGIVAITTPRGTRSLTLFAANPAFAVLELVRMVWDEEQIDVASFERCAKIYGEPVSVSLERSLPTILLGLLRPNDLVLRVESDRAADGSFTPNAGARVSLWPNELHERALELERAAARMIP